MKNLQQLIDEIESRGKIHCDEYHAHGVDCLIGITDTERELLRLWYRYQRVTKRILQLCNSRIK